MRHARYKVSDAGDGAILWQLLSEHLRNTARNAYRFALEAIPKDKTFHHRAMWCGLLHDIGKFPDKWQHRLNAAAAGKESGKKVPHSPLGAAAAFAAKAPDLCLAIYGHHSGLPNAKELSTFLQSYHDAGRESLQLAQSEIATLQKPLPPLAPPPEIFAAELRLRMLYSCLVDADRLDALRFDQGGLSAKEPLQADMLLNRLLTFVAKKAAESKAPPHVLQARQEVLQACLAASGRDARLLSLAVPTGGGKTLSSMAFALKHASLRPDAVRRIIIVVPFLSIIEQNARVYREALGEGCILEHHSGELGGLVATPGKGGAFGSENTGDKVFSLKDTENAALLHQTRRLELLRENWDAPIIITTAVRFFESLFSNKPSDARRLHNIARSVVILDETQTMPRQYLAPLLNMMHGLADEWDTHFVFCTATQPAFEKPLASELSPLANTDCRWEPGTIAHIIPPEMQRDLQRRLQRVAPPVWPQEGEVWSCERQAQELASHVQALCIVNTKRQARELYETSVQKGVQGVWHLSTRMCPVHREECLRRIHMALERGEACHIVSTQLIEAGVDISLPVVMRAMGPFDSIVQAAGRCDREGILTAQTGAPAGKLIVFHPEDSGNPCRQETSVTQTLCNAENRTLSLHDPDHVREYFNRLYQLGQDQQSIQPLRKGFNFKEVSSAFEMIQDRTRGVLIPYGEEGKSLLDEAAHTQHISRELLRRLQRYQVGLYPNEFAEAYALGLVSLVREDADLWRAQEDCYFADIGLRIAHLSAASHVV